MNTETIDLIMQNEHPECNVEGHRIHTTYTKNDEVWPNWGLYVYGIAGGFVHFENEKDFVQWHKVQNEIHPYKAPTDKKTEEVSSGRCVNECGPIGFGKYAA